MGRRGGGGSGLSRLGLVLRLLLKFNTQGFSASKISVYSPDELFSIIEKAQWVLTTRFFLVFLWLIFFLRHPVARVFLSSCGLTTGSRG